MLKGIRIDNSTAMMYIIDFVPVAVAYSVFSSEI
jgi:hypothetical protein